MGIHKIIEQMEKINLENQMKIITFKTWVTMTLNRRCYEHPFIAPPNLDVNLTLLECHELLFHTRHELLHQINED
jgi:hypothetical protein